MLSISRYFHSKPCANQWAGESRLHRATGAHLRGGALAEPVSPDTLSGPLDQPRATYTPPRVRAIVNEYGTLAEVVGEIDTLKQTATKKKSGRKRPHDTSFLRLGLQRRASFLLG